MQKIKNILGKQVCSIYNTKYQLIKAKRLLQDQFPELKEASFKVKGNEKLYILLSGLLSYEGMKKKGLYTDFLRRKSDIKYKEIFIIST